MTTPTLDARPDVIDDLTRRGFVGGVSMAALLAACGTESDPAPSPTGDAAAGSGFPVTIEHKYGSTIPAEPQRVVTVGYTDSDFVLALGIKPAAITDWYGDYPLGVWPWAQGALGNAKPGVMPRARPACAARPDAPQPARGATSRADAPARPGCRFRARPDGE